MSNLTPPSTNTRIVPPGIRESTPTSTITPPSTIQPPIGQVRSPNLNQGRSPNLNQVRSPNLNQGRSANPNQVRPINQGVDSSPIPVTSSKKSSTESYWKTPDLCHPARQPYKCPIGIYIFLLVFLAIINIWAIFRAPRIDNNGRRISTGTIWWAAIAGVAFHLIFGLMIGFYIFEHCRSCNQESRHLIFLLAVGTPIILGIIVGIIIGSIMNIGFLWTASREPNPESSNIDC